MQNDFHLFFFVNSDHLRAIVSIQNSSSSQDVLQALATKDLILAKFIQLLSQGIAASWVYLDGRKSKELFVFEFGNSRIPNAMEFFHGLKDILSISIYFIFLTCIQTSRGIWKCSKATDSPSEITKNFLNALHNKIEW